MSEVEAKVNGYIMSRDAGLSLETIVAEKSETGSRGSRPDRPPSYHETLIAMLLPTTTRSAWGRSRISSTLTWRRVAKRTWPNTHTLLGHGETAGLEVLAELIQGSHGQDNPLTADFF
jgi:hypothetical protein